MSKTSRKDLTTIVEGAAVVGRRRRRGTLLIALGLVVAAGAVALVVSGKKQSAQHGDSATGSPADPTLPPVERRDAFAAESAAGQDGSARQDSSAQGADDAVGDVERRVDNTLAGKSAAPEQPEGRRRGRHAAKE